MALARLMRPGFPLRPTGRRRRDLTSSAKPLQGRDDPSLPRCSCRGTDTGRSTGPGSTR
ncbi:hypothetical protein ACFFX0_31305 [Citricoccus parietis]|uniref:Uncharacterized protein n=1 Tax=Citricoccus parietis TaxID=592307 RepID=A0ABV5G9W1_9MICC